MRAESGLPDPAASLTLEFPEGIVPAMTAGAKIAKARMRAECLQRRRSMSAERAIGLSRAIAARALDLEEVAAAGAVHTYVDSLPNEVATRGIIAALLGLGKRIVVPVVAGAGRPLLHAEIGGLDELRRGPLGILQPRAGSALPPVDAVLVPAVACDREGNRLGMGGGHYDRMLRPLRVPAVALVYEEFVVAAVPAEAHDTPVDIVLTERNIYRTRPKGEKP